MRKKQFWIAEEQLLSKWKKEKRHNAGELELFTAAEMADQIRDFNLSLRGNSPWSDPLPQDFPKALLQMPKRGFAPDYFTVESWHFTSAKLIEAMALPDWAVDLRLADIVEGGSEAKSRHYHLMRLRAFAPAIDPDASLCSVKTFQSAKTGDLVTDLSIRGPIRFWPDFDPPCDLFADSNEQLALIVTDALAARVLDSGCIGIEFLHPSWLSRYPIRVLRTKDGLEKHSYADDDRSFRAAPISAVEADRGPPPPYTPIGAA